MTREYRWSKEQAEELMGSVARHGARWSLISRDVGRTAPACQSKWHRVREGTERGMGKDDELEPLWEGAQSFPKQWPLVASLVGTRPELSAITRNEDFTPNTRQSTRGKTKTSTLLSLRNELRGWRTSIGNS